MHLSLFYFLFFFLLSPLLANTQIAGEQIVTDDELVAPSNEEWIPTLLNANGSPLYNFVIYNGRIFSWNIRGSAQSKRIVDGIDWQSSIGQWSGDPLFAGIQFAYKSKEVVINRSYTHSAYWGYPIVNLISSESVEEKKSLAVISTFSNTMNTSNMKSIALLLKSGLRPGNLIATTALKFEDAPYGVLPNGFKQSFHFLLSVDKKWKHNSSIGVSLLWTNTNQGRAATSSNEAIELSQQRAYSPNWGWYHQRLYYPSTKQINVPVLSVRYQKKWNENAFLEMNNGLIVGNESRSSLTWTNSADPRPDYYKYLPSYTTDVNLKKQLSDWFYQHPEDLQIKFDQLENINKASKDGRSFYVVNQENNAMRMWHGSLLFSKVLPQKISIQTGMQYAFDQIHFYNTLKDLLGGAYYYNYNNWMNDDSLALSFQQDIQYPDKKIKQGERWGADYRMRSYKLSPWIQIQKQGPVFESSIAIKYGLEGIERIGYNQNGLYVNSKGSSGFQHFNTAELKAQLLYKLNGRIYLRSIFFSQWLAPSYQSIFIDPDLNAFGSPYRLQEKKWGADLSFFYRAPNLKTSLSVYHHQTNNETDNKMFYHDAYGLFVYGSTGHLNSVLQGLEWAVETSLLQNVKINYVTTLSNSFYTDDAYYQYLDINNLQIKEAGLLHLRDMSKSNGPVMVNAISLIYQPIYGYTFGLTTVYGQERPVAMNLFRRSDWVRQKVDPITWDQIRHVPLLKDQLVMNAFASRFFQFITKRTKKRVRWNTSISARNILNALIPIIAYEQTRFDYIRFNKEKFPIKYLMDAGASYSIRIQLQIQ